MKILSEDAKLSHTYTNHSIHSTALTTLDGNNIASRHIQALSGHKCESTIKTYAKKCPPAKKHEMFNLLQLDKSSDPASPKIPTPATSTVSKAPQSDNANVDGLDIDFLDFVLIENNQEDFDLAQIIK